jgi:integrase
MRAWRDAHPGPSNVAVVSISDRMLRCFNDDLVAAGIAKRVQFVAPDGPLKRRIDKQDASGRIVDLHALRHTFGTRLGRMPSIDPKSVQALLRHSDPRLTFGVYVHSDRERLAAAVALLPTIPIAAASNPQIIDVMESQPRFAGGAAR